MVAPRALDSCRMPEGSWALGTRMLRALSLLMWMQFVESVYGLDVFSHEIFSIPLGKYFFVFRNTQDLMQGLIAATCPLVYAPDKDDF